MAEQVGHKIIGIIKQVKGECSFGHKVGEKFELSGHNTGGLCGFLYHDIFPYIIMLQFGGKFPDDWGGDILELDCPDKFNAVRIELRREE